MIIVYKELEEIKELNKFEVKEPILILAKGNHWFIKCFGENSIYSGYWVEKEKEFLKIISDIEFQEEIKSIEILDPESAILHTQDDNSIKVFLSNNSLNIQAIRPIFLTIYFDVRKLYSTINEGQIYNFLPSEKSFYVYFKQEKENFDLDFQIIFDGNLQVLNEFSEKDFLLDKKRNSSFYKFKILKGIQGYVTNLEIKTDFYNPEIKFDIEEINPLKNFTLKRILSLYNGEKLRAGLFWFPQRWYRDELLTLIFLSSNKSLKDLKNRILEYYLNNLDFVWNKNKEKDPIISVDTLLLLINALDEEFIRKNRNLFVDYLNKWEKSFIKESTRLPSKSTWMDTKNREVAFEVDALFLSSLNKLELINDLKKYKTSLKVKIFSNQYPKNELISPNSFIAYFFYKDFFEEYEWLKLFDEVIEQHYLEWGGFSSASKQSPEFYENHTGEDSRSYHSGDSWFWINNLGAYVLENLSFKKYEEKINKIKKASIYNLLALKGLGYMSELSSAKELRYEGCVAQLWSLSSLFLLL